MRRVRSTGFQANRRVLSAQYPESPKDPTLTRQHSINTLLPCDVPPLTSKPRKGESFHFPAWFAAAGRSGDHTVVRSLAEQIPNINTVDKKSTNGFTALHYAVAGNLIETTKVLVEAGADVDYATRKLGQTPLAVACQCGHDVVVGYLIGKGANPMIADRMGKTAYDFATTDAVQAALRSSPERSKHLRRVGRKEAATKPPPGRLTRDDWQKRLDAAVRAAVESLAEEHARKEGLLHEEFKQKEKALIAEHRSETAELAQALKLAGDGSRASETLQKILMQRNEQLEKETELRRSAEKSRFVAETALASLEGKIANLEAALREATASLREKEKEVASLRQRLEKANTRHLDASSATEKTKTFLQSLQRELEEARADAKNKDAELLRTKMHCGIAHSNARRLEDSLDRKATRVYDLERMLHSTELQALRLAQMQDEMMEQLSVAKEQNRAQAEKVTQLHFKLECAEEEARGRAAEDSVVPPEGTVAIVFTDVKGSTTQWEQHPETTAAAISVHNRLLRTILAMYKGYEVKTEGDSFMVAFSDPYVALQWCCDVQNSLLDADWPETLEHHEDAALVYWTQEQEGEWRERHPQISSQPSLQQLDKMEDELRDPLLLFKGFRVRMGVHMGPVNGERDPVTKRMDYFGSTVNKAARVEGMAQGGQILISGEVFDSLSYSQRKEDAALLDAVFHQAVGVRRLKGMENETSLIQILPWNLRYRSRIFDPLDSPHEEHAKRLAAEIEALRTQNTFLQERLEHLEDKMGNASNYSARLAETLMRIGEHPELENTRELSTALVDIERIRAEHTVLQKEIKQTCTSNDAMVAKVSLLSNDLHKSMSRAQKNEAKILQLQDELFVVRHDYEAKRRALRELKAKKEKEVGTAKVAEHQAETALMVAKKKIAVLHKDNSHLRECVNASTAKAMELEDACANFKAEVAQRRIVNKALHEELLALRGVVTKRMAARPYDQAPRAFGTILPFQYDAPPPASLPSIESRLKKPSPRLAKLIIPPPGASGPRSPS